MSRNHRHCPDISMPFVLNHQANQSQDDIHSDFPRLHPYAITQLSQTNELLVLIRIQKARKIEVIKFHDCEPSLVVRRLIDD